MTKKLTALAAVLVFLITQRPHAQASGARIFFVDVGQGASTLIVSPTGKTLLVDGGPPGGGAKVNALLTTLGISAIDFTVVTHYHIDHISGVTELLNLGRVAGTAFDNGDGADVQPPGTSTSPNSTRGNYLNYITATGHAGVTRQTIQPGQVIDLGGGMRATCIVAGGRMLSGGSAAITNADLNTESISLLIEYNDFDYLVSGDLTGGGSTSTAKTPDIETYVGQMVGDVDVVQLDHHGSTTANNQVFLSALKAEVAFAQTGETNTFGHPNRETVNKYLNTSDTAGHSFTSTGVPPAGSDPVFYQNEASPAGDDRVTQQGYTGAATGNAGQGTILLSTDGTTTYSLASFDDGGVRLNAAAHSYGVDGVSAGVTTDFPPTVLTQTNPVLPLATDSVVVSASVNDRESPISSVTLAYAVNGTAQAPLTMALSGAQYEATIPLQPDGTRVDYAVTASTGGQTTTFSSGYFSGTTTISSLRVLNAKGEPLYTGYAARLLGTVTASGFSGPGTNDDYVQDPTGAINVYRTTDTPTPFVPTTPGQTVEARGRIGFNGGRLRLDIMESIEKTTSPYGVTIASAGPEPTPVATTIAAIAGSPESFEGQLVSIPNVSITSGTIPATPQSIDAFVTVTDGTGTFSLKIDDDTDLEGFTPAATFTAVGIIQQDDFLRPFDAGYDITPRSRVDIGGPAAPPVPLLTIAEARIDQVINASSAPGSDFIPDRVGQTVKVRGAVTSTDFRGGNGIEYYIQDPTAGIDLFSTTLSPTFEIGDNVEAVGVVTHFNGLTELTITSLAPIGGTTETAPQVVTLAQLGNGGAGEAFEGRLVRVDNVLITGGSFPATNGSANVTIVDATGTGTLRIDGDTDIDGTPTPTGVLSITGVVGQFASAPFDSGYQLLPRELDDVEASACSAITISGTLPGGNAGVPYSQTLTASGEPGPYTFTIASGTAPTGLTLGTDGVLSGTPTAGGTFAFTVRATTAGGCLGVASFSVTIVSTAPVLSVSSPSLAFGPITVGTSSPQSLTLTNTGNATLTLGALTVTGADPTQFAAGTPGATTLAPAASTTVSIAFQPTTAGAKSATLTIASNGGSPSVELTGTGVTGGPTGTGVVISEFRTHGTAGGNDEFVEIYNNSTAAIDISGWKLLGSSNTAPTGTRATVPANTVLPAHAHYLFVNTAANGYSLAVPGNVSYTTGISDNGGMALVLADGTIVDQVGVTTTGTAYREGNPLTTQLTTNTNRSYERKPGGVAVTLQDTNDNATDFQLLNGTAPNVPNPQNIVVVSAPEAIDFGSVMSSDTRSQTLTIKNLLLTSVTLDTPFAVTGTDATQFSVAAPASTTLAPAGETTATVTFQPTTPGTKSATLLVSSTSGGARSIALSGLASCPAVTVAATLPNAEFGVAYSQTFSASGGGGGPFTFAVTSGAPPGGLILDAGGSLSGTPGALGVFAFSVEATAANGCPGSAPFTLTVADTTAPVLSLPGNLSATATSPSGAIVSFVASASDLVDGTRPVACIPASGSTFPIGTTTVACSASDLHANTANGSFAVTVTTTPQTGRMIGIGQIAAGAVTHAFDFFVQEQASGADLSAISYRRTTNRPGPDLEDRFDAIAITGVTFFNVPGVTPGTQPPSGVDTVMFAGRGRWNGRSGYTFEARATDAGEPGRGRDTFVIAIRDAAGAVVASVNATLTSGNVQSLRGGR